MESKNNSTHKLVLSKEQIEEMMNFYEGYITYNTNSYTIARAKLQDATITFYKTYTVLFQGEKETIEYNYWAKKYNYPLDEIIDKSLSKYQNLSVIGCDEVGCGDYFGPIITCSTYVSSNMIEDLVKLGVKDSKLLTDEQIKTIGFQLIKMIPYSIMEIEPEKYNRLTNENSNMNFLKSYLHNKTILSILKKLTNVKYDAIIIDEFTPKEKYFEYLKNQDEVEKNITMITKGEKAHIAVAAASIIARLAFLKKLKAYNDEYDTLFLKGASKEVDRMAISFVKSNGWDTLSKVAKLKFANTERIREYFTNNPLPKAKQGSFKPINNDK